MNSHQQPSASYLPTASAPATFVAAGGEFAPFDVALHVAAVREAAAMPEGAPLMAAGGWSAVVAPEDPRALELRHIPFLPAVNAARVRELFAEVVDAGGHCQGDAWEVLTLWELGSSSSATAAANAVMILVGRAVEADAAAGHPDMPDWIKDGAETRLRDLLDDHAEHHAEHGADEHADGQE